MSQTSPICGGHGMAMVHVIKNGPTIDAKHVGSTDAQEPYDRLKRALRAEIDEDAWAPLYSTESRPFPKPESGKTP